MTTPFKHTFPLVTTTSEDFAAVDITSAYTFSPTRPRAVIVNNPGSSLQTLLCRAEGATADSPFICGPGATMLPISPLTIQAHATLTVVALW